VLIPKYPTVPVLFVKKGPSGIARVVKGPQIVHPLVEIGSIVSRSVWSPVKIEWLTTWGGLLSQCLSPPLIQFVSWHDQLKIGILSKYRPPPKKKKKKKIEKRT
jgi:hypothetical protein